MHMYLPLTIFDTYIYIFRICKYILVYTYIYIYCIAYICMPIGPDGESIYDNREKLVANIVQKPAGNSF